ncbi:MAG: helix-turn-helix domain-containing protein [Candidatus Bathyarchaeota archaeon]|jgi:hypothetical protein
MIDIEEGNLDNLFEAISHPLRIEILQALAKRPMRFADLKKRFEITSSGGLDFHLRKLGDLIATNNKGAYGVTKHGFKALMAIGLVQGWGGWQKMAYYTVLTAILIAGIYLASTNNSALLFVVFLGTVLWMAFLPHY